MMKIIYILFLICLFAGSISAADIVGTVTDVTTNQPMPAANIIILGTNYGAAAATDGSYRIEDVPPGIYSLRADVIGYTAVTKTDVVVTPVRPVTVNFELRQTVLEFGDITVRPDFFSESNDKPVSTQIQTSEEIRRLPGNFEDVVRAVSILPGVAQAQAGRNDLIVRGGAPSENLYVVDGIAVNNINHFGTQGASGGPQSFINLDYVQQTEFATGGFGVRYGDKLSSVLSIDLKEGREDRIGGELTLSATQFGLDLEGPLSRNGNFIFSARRSYLDFIFKANGFGFVPEYWDFLAKESTISIPITKLRYWE
ncbi:MAG: carboxypeptidase regulatory-like domain-containing protein [candidate division KSB1 bacterium]|nr:carboxypeptidase regulatory-like domain-containing protein [candidate division KSB1 bacterium]